MSKILSLASELSTIRSRKNGSAAKRTSFGMNVPRGIRNNNPGNIEKNPANAWQGRVPLAENTDGRFEQFTSYAYGVRALIMLLRTYINSGRNTITAIFSAYAPAGENNTQQYIKFVADRLGVSATATIPLSKAVLRELAKAIGKMENGQECISDAQFEEGWNLLSTDVKNAIAQSFAYQKDYSRPFYDTGEHAVLGTYIKGVSPAPIASVTALQPETTYNINGVTFTYGQIITMGDFFKDYNELKIASQQLLIPLRNLLNKAETYYTDAIFQTSSTTSNPENADWNKTIPNYYLLAEKNNSHFAPAAAGTTTIKENHKQFWEKYHTDAIAKARSGTTSPMKDEAYVINAFGDHYLTDAFSAGHLFNKEQVMQKFLANCLSGNTIKKDADTMLEKLADAALADPKVKAVLAKWETHAGGGITKAIGTVLGGVAGYLITDQVVGKGFDLDTTTPVKVFYRVLKGIMEDTDGRIQLANLAVKAVHDYLNNYSGGVPVHNVKGHNWKLTGDGTLNKANVEIIQLAVKQSVENVEDAFLYPATPVSGYYKKVWDYVPDVNYSATKSIVDAAINNFTNPASPDLLKKAIDLLKGELPLLLEKLKEKKLISAK